MDSLGDLELYYYYISFRRLSAQIAYVVVVFIKQYYCNTVTRHCFSHLPNNFFDDKFILRRCQPFRVKLNAKVHDGDVKIKTQFERNVLMSSSNIVVFNLTDFIVPTQEIILFHHGEQ